MIRVYHGSDHIIQYPQYLGGKKTMIMTMDFIQLNMRTEQEAGRD